MDQKKHREDAQIAKRAMKKCIFATDGNQMNTDKIHRDWFLIYLRASDFDLWQFSSPFPSRSSRLRGYIGSGKNAKKNRPAKRPGGRRHRIGTT